MRWQNANRLRDLWTGYISDSVSRCAADFGSPRLRTSCSSPTTKTFFCFKTLLRKWFLFFSFAAYSEGGYTVGLTSRPSLDSDRAQMRGDLAESDVPDNHNVDIAGRCLRALSDSAGTFTK